MKYRVNTLLVKTFIDSRNINALAFYYMVKLTFKNSVIYKNNKGKVSSRMIGDMFNISHNVANNYIKVLKEEGLLVEHKGNLLFVSLKHNDLYSHQKRKNTVPMEFDDDDTIKSIADKLKAAIVVKNLLNQKFMIDLKFDLLNNKQVNLKHYKKYLMNANGEKRKVNEDLQLSNAAVAKMLNCSKQSATVQKKKWKDLGLMQCVKVYKVLGNVGRNFNGSTFGLGGKTFVSGMGNIYEYQYSKVILGSYLTKLIG